MLLNLLMVLKINYLFDIFIFYNSVLTSQKTATTIPIPMAATNKPMRSPCKRFFHIGVKHFFLLNRCHRNNLLLTVILLTYVSDSVACVLVVDVCGNHALELMLTVLGECILLVGISCC